METVNQYVVVRCLYQQFLLWTQMLNAILDIKGFCEP